MMRAFSFGLCLLTLVAPVMAEEVSLSNGQTATAKGFEIETQNATGVKTLVLNMAPNFDPEPNGVLPSDDFARVHEALCNDMARINEGLIREHGVSRFRARWKWTPEQTAENQAAGITVTRSHQSDFELDDNLGCVPVPNEVRPDDVAMTTPTGLDVRLRYVETNDETGNLDLIYDVGQPLDEIADQVLDNSARELCILHADGVLEHRKKYYDRLGYDVVAIVFAQEQPRSVTRGFLFGVDGATCKSGLSPAIADTIRSQRG